MVSNNLQLKLKKAGLFFSLVFSFALLSSVDVNAQGRGNQNKYEKQREKIERKQEKFEEKMEKQRAKIEQRQDRWENRDNRDYDDDGYYRNNDRNNGYYGNNGNGNYGSRASYETARRNGYEDGLRAGAEDARDGDRYNPQGHSDFRKASDGYNSRYGNKGQYMQAYRDAFVQGYREAYGSNNSNRNRNGRWGW
jgi:hypothetical protein